VSTSSRRSRSELVSQCRHYGCSPPVKLATRAICGLATRLRVAEAIRLGVRAFASAVRDRASIDDIEIPVPGDVTHRRREGRSFEANVGHALSKRHGGVNLGRSRNPDLKDVFTKYTRNDIYDPGVLAPLIGSGLVDSSPLQDLIANYVDDRFLRDIARERRKGRLLLISTTNLDAERPVLWDMGRIAMSGHPQALGLFRKVLLASASIPGAFPPVRIQVRAELHAGALRRGIPRRYAGLSLDEGPTGTTQAAHAIERRPIRIGASDRSSTSRAAACRKSKRAPGTEPRLLGGLQGSDARIGRTPISCRLSQASAKGTASRNRSASANVANTRLCRILSHSSSCHRHGLGMRRGTRFR